MRKRGEIWLADLDMRDWTAPGKIRPVLIVQSQFLLDADHPSTLVVPLTSSLLTGDAAPLRLCVAAAGDLHKDSDLLIDQLRALDNARFLRGPLLRLSSSLMASVDIALREVMDLDETFD